MVDKENIRCISHGAEAKIYEDVKSNTIYKHRLSKPYRVKELDDYLIRKRTKCEILILSKLYTQKINVPKLLSLENKTKIEFLFKDCEISTDNEIKNFTNRNTIMMQKIKGPCLKEYIERNINNKDKLIDIFTKFGCLIKQIHDSDVIHGDITTLNFIVSQNESEDELSLYAIDFGLSSVSVKNEDKAVDLYVFEKSLKCDYQNEMYENFISWFYNAYNDKYVLKRLEIVRLRGRKREENAVG